MIYDMIIVGAGPAGIAMAVEARFAGIPDERLVIIEKDQKPCWSIRTQYPESKLVTANYKGYHNVVHDGVMRIGDMGKSDSLDYLTNAISDNELNIHYGEAMKSIKKDYDSFLIETVRGQYKARVCVIAVGILGRPNRPEYKIPLTVKSRIHFNAIHPDFNGLDLLVVGGGDSAAERVIDLHAAGNKVTLSYRGTDFPRMTETNREIIADLVEKGEISVLMGSNIVKLERDGVKPKVTFAETEYGPMIFDRVFYCIGGTAAVSFLKDTGVRFDDDRPVLSGHFETSVPGLFLAGDLTAGQNGGSINWAFATARKSMTYIAESYLSDVAAGA